MPIRTSFLFALCSAAIMVSAAHAGEQSLSAKREFLTAEQLYDDFLADFGGDPKPCYADYTLREVAPPDGPETMGRRWKKAIVALDASGSMMGRAGGARKMDAAKAAVRAFLKSAPAEAEIGLLAFGHRGSNKESDKARSCAAVELLAAPATDRNSVAGALDTLRATGWTPLAAAITKAGQSFTPAAGEGEQVIFVVSDGLETCRGDPVAAAKALHLSDTKAVVNIIGFDIPDRDRKALEAVADAGGGAFSHAADQKELEERLRVRYANLQEISDYDTASLQAKSDNNTSALEAASHANTCVLDIVNNERTTFLELTQKMVEAGQTDSESSRAAYKRLGERHEKLKADMRAFHDRVTTEMETVNARIEEQRARVKSEYGKD